MECVGEGPRRFLDGCGSRSAAGRSLLVKHLRDCCLLWDAQAGRRLLQTRRTAVYTLNESGLKS